mgnify:CR=1 FL=1
MITPNIAPRKIMGSATAGLFSAAKSSIRRMEKTTDAISKAPDVTKEQKFGINYVQFFGSKKNSKILKKSLKSIRDSLVATFEIAKLLRSEVSKNVKLIGEKTKGKKGFFGLGLGGILGLASLLTNPIVLTVLGIGAGLAGGFALFDYLKDNKDEIVRFIMDKAKGLYNTLQGFVANIIRDFLGDRFKSPETRNLEIESENNIDDEIKRLQKLDPTLTRGQARIQATKKEIADLEERRDLLKDINRSSAQDKELNAIKARIEQLKTGKSTFDRKNLPFPFGRMANFFEGETQRRAVFLPENISYEKMNDSQKFEAIKGLAGNFISKGNSLDRVREIYERSLKDGEASTNPDKALQAMDLIEFARRKDPVTLKEENQPSVDNFKFFDPKDYEASFFDDTDLAKRRVNNKGRIDPTILKAYPELDPTDPRDYMKLKRLQRRATDLDIPLASNNGVSGKPNLSQVPVEASSSPSCRYYSNFDGDNDLPGFNRSLLCIT